MKRALLLVLLCGLPATVALAGTGDITLNDSSAQGQIRLPLSEDAYGSVNLGARVLYNEDEDTKLVSAGLDFSGAPGNVPGLEAGVGAQVYGGEADDDQDLLALALGIQAKMAPPALGGFGLSGKLYYAPEVFSTLDAERLVETGVRAFYAMTPKVRVLVEYQNIRTRFEDRGNWSIDDDVRIGFEADF